MIFEHLNYRSFLKDVLVARSEKNPSYSLRAMANQLKVSPATLSQVIKGNKNFSPETAQLVAQNLDLSEREAEYFHLLVQFETTKNNELKETIIQKMKNLNPERPVVNLNLDYFRIISDWYHFAILALVEVDDFKSEPKWIAERLNLAVPAVELAIERLLRIEMLERNAKGQLLLTHSHPRISATSPDEGVRRYHRQNLELAIRSLETQTSKEKVIGTETMAIDDRDIEKYRELSYEYFDKFSALAEKSRRRNQVYHLGIQFFRLTKKGDLK